MGSRRVGDDGVRLIRYHTDDTLVHMTVPQTWAQ